MGPIHPVWGNGCNICHCPSGAPLWSALGQVADPKPAAAKLTSALANVRIWMSTYVNQGQHFHPHPQAPWVKLTVTLTLAPGGGGGNVDPWRPWDFLEALDGQLRCRRRFFFQKNGPLFLEALDGQLRCRRRFFFSEKWHHISGSPEQLTWVHISTPRSPGLI